MTEGVSQVVGDVDSQGKYVRVPEVLRYLQVGKVTILVP